MCNTEDLLPMYRAAQELAEAFYENKTDYFAYWTVVQEKYKQWLREREKLLTLPRAHTVEL